ncbi:MAG: hypothetical protein ACOY6K_22210 [Pseudomonadota bacterium]
MRRSSQGRASAPLRTTLIYAGFAVLAVLATAPAWRLAVFGFSIDDLLQLRCF